MPVLTVTSVTASASNGKIASVEWKGLRCRIKVEGAPVGSRLDLREKVADAQSTLADKVVAVKDDGSGLLFAREDGDAGKAAFVVLIGPDDQVCGKAQTVVGGDQ